MNYVDQASFTDVNALDNPQSFNMSQQNNDEGVSPYAITVSQYIEITDGKLKDLGFATVVGEISELKAYSHLYFKIKDESAAVDCIMFAGNFQRLSFTPKVGQKVQIVGEGSIYQKTGQFKIKVVSMQEIGIGAIMERLRLLKERLQFEGVFSHVKRPIPQFINTVGVITSSEGRVVHDIQMTMQRRNDGVNIIVYPAAVQGESAPKSLINALNLANAQNLCDVLIIGRGGGSFEDLLPFSDEALVRAVADSKIPIISAVGHEPDVALTDFAADLRAATPTAAAEIVTSVTKDQLYGYVEDINRRLSTAIYSRLDYYKIKLDAAKQRLRSASPEIYVNNLKNKLDNLNQRLDAAVQGKIYNYNLYLSNVKQRLSAFEPMQMVANLNGDLNTKINRLNQAIDNLVIAKKQRLNFDYTVQRYNFLIDNVALSYKNELKRKVLRLNSFDLDTRLNNLSTEFSKATVKLQGLNPLYILSKGYSITFDENDKSVDIAKVKTGDTIKSKLQGGTIVSTVTEVFKDTKA